MNRLPERRAVPTYVEMMAHAELVSERDRLASDLADARRELAEEREHGDELAELLGRWDRNFNGLVQTSIDAALTRHRQRRESS